MRVVHSGKTPDIRSNEYDDKQCWIPGFKYEHVSTPAPPNRARDIELDADLMSLAGQRRLGPR